MFRIKLLKTFLILFLFSLIFPVRCLFADTADLTAEQKSQKLQEFNEAVSEQKAAAEAAAAAATPPEKPWSLSVSTNYGHDDNTSFSSNRRRDTFRQETVTGALQYNHPAWGPLGDGKFGLSGTLDDNNYSKENGSDYRNSKINPYVTLNFTKTLSLRADYTFKDASYRHNHSLTYHGHEFKVALSESKIAKQIHKVYATTEYNDYVYRKQLSDSNISLNDPRIDRRQEAGYDFTYLATTSLIMGAAVAYQINDSNDLFHDLNDYEGYKITGYVYYAFNDKVSWVGAAGYDFKTYEHKLLPTNLAGERDEFIYAVNYLFFKISPRTQFIVSYFYDQNFSNDVLLDFTGHTVTAGFTVKI